MLVPLSWMKDVLPTLDVSGRELADALIAVGLEVERVEHVGIDELVIGRVLEFAEEPQKNGKTIRWCQVEIGTGDVRGIVCGAANFAPGDLVVVALPGAVLPGGFEIAARKTYGHVSDGMICSSRELGLGDDHDGILIIDPVAYPGVDVGMDAADALDLVDEVLDIAVTPDRGYCLSIRGIARETAVALDLPYSDPGARVLPGDVRHSVEVTLADTDGCDRYIALEVEGIDPAAPTPTWMSRRLQRVGIRPISLAVDVTNYVLIELGQPLHAFDAAKLKGGITVRRAEAGETLTTLDDVERALVPSDLVIADASGPIALAGVMGGTSTEIDATTTNVLIEAAHFGPVVVARTARRLKLTSEASRRFERGVDPALSSAAAAAAAALLVEYGGGRTVACTEVDLRKPLPSITFPLSLPGHVGGRAISGDVVRHRLAQVGANLSGGDPATVVPPPWRPDLAEPIDLVEEVLRLEGYETLPVLLPKAPSGHGLTLGQRRRRAVSRRLAADGFVEVQTVPFTGDDPLGLPADDARRPAVRLVNPLAANESYLRTTLLPGLLSAVGRNVSRGQRNVAIYETGLVFRPRTAPPIQPPEPAVRPSDATLAALDASLPDQPERAAVVLTGLAEPAGWWGPGRVADWSDAVAAVVATAAVVGIDLEIRADPHEPWHPGRVAGLFVGDTLIGHAGELHPALLERLDLPPRTCAAEWSLDALFAAADAAALPELGPVSTYPPGIVDVALIVPDPVPAQAVEDALRDGAGSALESLTLFDLYRGAPVPDGQRSLAYTLVFRAPDRTLSGDEVNGWRDAAIAAAEKLGAVLRA
jgi:phenylalanyl-tRNA synthetase beta chain